MFGFINEQNILKEPYMKHHILCINTGSSSMKFAMHLFGTSGKLIVEGAAERSGLSGGWLWLKNSHGKRPVDKHADFFDHKAAVKAMFPTVIEEQHLPAPDGVRHRFVHKGNNTWLPKW
jgi:acetate kinase